MRRAAIHFLPLLLLYIGLVFAEATDGLRQDEPTYLVMAESLRDGRCTVEGTEFFWAGPGYPAVIAMGQELGLSPGAIKYGNAVFLYLAVLLLFGTLSRSLTVRRSRWIAVAFGLYWPAFEQLGYLMTEPFVTFLVAALLFTGTRFLGGSLWWGLLAAPLLAGLALTKLIFGYVLVAALIVSLVWLVVRRSASAGRCLAVLAVALSLCTPYLVCTQQVTGRYFLWGTSGGMQLYWMTSPHAEEHGDWINYVFAGLADPTDKNPVIRNHAPVFRRALGYESNFETEPYEALIRRLGVQQQDVFYEAAFENLKAAPLAYAGNWIANIGRLVVGAPFSYQQQDARMLGYAIPNIALLTLVLLGVLVLWRRRGGLPAEYVAILVFLAIYLGGVSLVSCYPRFFTIVAPMLIWLAATGWREPARVETA